MTPTSKSIRCIAMRFLWTFTRCGLFVARSVLVLSAVIVTASFQAWPVAGAETSPPREAERGKAIEKAFISFRIGVPQWMAENRYRDLLAIFEKYKGVTDEITFFTSATQLNTRLVGQTTKCG